MTTVRVPMTVQRRPAEEPSGAALLTSPVRRAIVDTLANADRDVEADTARAGMSAAQLAELLELHVTTVRFHLDQLVAAGLVTTEFRRVGVGRPRKVYDLAPGSLDTPEHAGGLKILTELLAETFGQGEVTPQQAGERWAAQHIPASPEPAATSPGQWLGKVGQMVDLLGEWGYTPELATTEGGRSARIDLVRCPFLDLAHSNPAVVCGIHRGLISGAMTRLGEPDAEVSLEPFVGPELCQAHVRTRTPFSTTRSSHQPSTKSSTEESR